MVSEWQILRRVMLPVFAKMNPGDVTITHHYTQQPFFLHSYKHKGYWFHGKRRESRSMELFGQLVRPGDTVIEVGAHIGYVSMYFAHLVGPLGHVLVMEPGPNNLRYLKRNCGTANINRNVRLVPKAAGLSTCRAPFFVEDLTGQNGTLMPGFDRFERNRASQCVHGEYRRVIVDVVPVDAVVAGEWLTPSFIKVDTEGAELDVLTGMATTLCAFRPRLMVEVQLQGTAVFRMLHELGYVLFSDKRQPLEQLPERMEVGRNVFCIHSGDVDGLRVMSNGVPELAVRNR